VVKLPRRTSDPPPTVITTTTINDDDLSDLTYQDELDILTRFDPDIHLPADVSIYERHDPDQRQARSSGR
jgi:hypothetical protein